MQSLNRVQTSCQGVSVWSELRAGRPALILALTLMLSQFGCTGRAEVNAPLKKGKDGLLEITPEQMKFPSRSIERKLLAFNAVANGFAEEGWHRRPFRMFSPPSERNVYHAEWATFASKTNRNPANYYGEKELHSVSISAGYDRRISERCDAIIGVRLGARWKPAGTGWGGGVRYATFEGQPFPHKRPSEDFHVELKHFRPSTDDSKLPRRIVLARSGACSYVDIFHFQDPGDKHSTSYEFSVSTHTFAERQAFLAIPADDDARRILASAESMRDFGVEIYGRLLQQVERDFAGGKALKSAEYARMLEHNEDANALASDRPLSAAEQKLVFDSAKSSVQAKIDALREHHVEMYAAVRKAFPLVECLKVD